MQAFMNSSFAQFLEYLSVNAKSAWYCFVMRYIQVMNNVGRCLGRFNTFFLKGAFLIKVFLNADERTWLCNVTPNVYEEFEDCAFFFLVPSSMTREARRRTDVHPCTKC